MLTPSYVFQRNGTVSPLVAFPYTQPEGVPLQFESFDLDPRVVSAIQKVGYRQPTEIQQLALPPALQGRDVMGLAQTGTGKTAAFALPLLQRLLAKPGPRGRVQALILAPTRELADQIREEVASLGQNTGLRSLTIYGGVNINPQISALRGSDRRQR
jgi:ATP-dependent RNA helicase RhlE